MSHSDVAREIDCHVLIFVVRRLQIERGQIGFGGLFRHRSIPFLCRCLDAVADNQRVQMAILKRTTAGVVGAWGQSARIATAGVVVDGLPTTRRVAITPALLHVL